MPVSLGQGNEGDIVIRVTADTTQAEVSLANLMRNIQNFRASFVSKSFGDLTKIFDTLVSSQTNFLSKYKNFVDSYERINRVWLRATEKQRERIAKAFGLDDAAIFNEMLKSAGSNLEKLKGTANLLNSIFGTPTQSQFIGSIRQAKAEYEQLKEIIPHIEKIRKLPYDTQLKILPTMFGESFRGHLGVKAFQGMYDDLIKRRDELGKALRITGEESFFRTIVNGFNQAHEQGYRLSRTLSGITFRAIYLVFVLGMVFSAVNALRAGIISLSRAFEEYNQTVSAFAGMALVFSEKKPGENLGDQFMRSLNYAKQLYTTMEDIAATTLMTGEQANLMARQFLQAGIIIDANNEAQKRGLQTIANVLFLLTQGQNQNVQIISELRNLLSGQITPREVFGTLLKSIEPNIDEKIKEWRKQGASAVIEGIANLLQGMEVASLRIARSWTAVWTQLGTTIVRTTRPAVQEIYNYVVDLLVKINSSIEEGGSVVRNRMAEIGRIIVKIIDSLIDFAKWLWEIREVLFVISTMIVSAFAFRFIGGGIAGLASILTMIGKIKEGIKAVGSVWAGVSGAIAANSVMFLSAVNTVGAIFGGLVAIGYVIYTIHRNRTREWREELEKVKFTIESLGGTIEDVAAKQLATLIQNTRKLVPEMSKWTTEEFVAAYRMGKLKEEEVETSESVLGEEIFYSVKVLKSIDDQARDVLNTFKYLYANAVERGREIRNQMVEQGFMLETQIKLLTEKEARMRATNQLHTEEGQELMKKLALYREQLSRINYLWELIDKFPKEQRDRIAMTPDENFIQTIAALEKYFEKTHPEFKGLHESLRKNVFLAFMAGWYDAKKVADGIVFTPKISFLLGFENLLSGQATDEEKLRYMSELKKYSDELTKMVGKKGLDTDGRNKALQEAEKYINRYLAMQREYLEILKRQNDALIEQATHEKEINMLRAERQFMLRGADIEREMDLLKTAYQNLAIPIDIYFSRMEELYIKQSQLERDRINKEKEEALNLLNFKIGLKTKELDTLITLEGDAYAKLSKQIQTISKKSSEQVQRFIKELVQTSPKDFVSKIESFVGKEDPERVFTLLKTLLDNFEGRTEEAKRALQSLRNEVDKLEEEYQNKLIQNTITLKKNLDSLTMEKLLSESKKLSQELEIINANLEKLDFLLKKAEFKGDITKKYELLYQQSISQRDQALNNIQAKIYEAMSKQDIAIEYYEELLGAGKLEEAAELWDRITGEMQEVIDLYGDAYDAASEYYDEVIARNKQIMEAVANRDLGTLFTIGFKEAGKQYDDLAQNILEATRDITRGMENAFMDFFDVTSQNFMKFGKLITSILGDIYKALLRALIINPLISGLTSLFGLSSTAASTSQIQLTPPRLDLPQPQLIVPGGIILRPHEGGYIPRFHYGGLAYDEVPAILQKGEYVVSRKGVEMLDRINEGKPLGNVNVVVNVENRTGIPVNAEQKTQPYFDGEKFVVNVVLKNIQEYGVLRHAIAGVR